MTVRSSQPTRPISTPQAEAQEGAAPGYDDEKYYRAVPPGSLAERLSIRAHDAIYADFIRLCAPSDRDTILDVGVSDTINDSANFIERKYPLPERIMACGLAAGDGFMRSFPEVAYHRIKPEAPLPFPDRTFSIAAANAVLEHVGSSDGQARFIDELARVARTVFITIPNRYFPVEHHTRLPFLHYSDPTFRIACRLTARAEWADPANLILMSKARLGRVSRGHAGRVIGHTGLRLGPFSSNLFLLIER